MIPLENLVAQSDRIIAAVKDEKEADVALTVLEMGNTRDSFSGPIMSPSSEGW